MRLVAILFVASCGHVGFGDVTGDADALAGDVLGFDDLAITP